MTKTYDDTLMNRSSSNTSNSQRSTYTFALSRSPSVEDESRSPFGANSYAASSPGLLAEHHGPLTSASNSRRSSIQSTNSSLVARQQAESPNRTVNRTRKRDRFLQFAKMKNPTLSIQITPEWTIDFTYAELLQYASMALTSRRIVQFYWPIEIQPDSISHSNRTSFQHLLKTPFVVYCNMVIFILASASIEGRKRAEQLGLRRTCLMLCLTLFVLASISALWPVEKIDGKIIFRHQIQQTSSQDQITKGNEKDHSMKMLPLTIPERNSYALSAEDDAAIQRCYEASSEEKMRCEKSKLVNQDEVVTFLSSLSPKLCSSNRQAQNPSFVRIQTKERQTLLILCNSDQ